MAMRSSGALEMPRHLSPENKALLKQAFGTLRSVSQFRCWAQKRLATNKANTVYIRERLEREQKELYIFEKNIELVMGKQTPDRMARLIAARDACFARKRDLNGTLEGLVGRLATLQNQLIKFASLAANLLDSIGTIKRCILPAEEADAEDNFVDRIVSICQCESLFKEMPEEDEGSVSEIHMQCIKETVELVRMKAELMRHEARRDEIEAETRRVLDKLRDKSLRAR